MVDAKREHPAKEGPSFEELKRSAADLKVRIDEALKRKDMPIDSALGNPKWEEEAANGRYDHHDGEDDE